MLRAGAEEGADGWTLDGFRDVGESETIDYDNYYVASNGQYVSYDQYLKSGPYNFGDPNRPTTWAEHFPYQDGLIVSYWDTSFSNNNTSQHFGQGEILVVTRIRSGCTTSTGFRGAGGSRSTMRIRVQPAPAAAARD